MTRQTLWQTIHTALAAEIAAGHYRTGDKLPTEAKLATRFGVNRHTVRQALAALAEAGTVHSRRGAGVFVTTHPTDYPLGRRVRFQQNLAASGRSASRRITLIDTRVADEDEAKALHLLPGDLVHVVEGVSLADNAPLATFRSVFPAAALPGLPQAVQEHASITAALGTCGIADYTRAETRITAKLANPVLALTLQIAQGAPILRSVAVNVDQSGRPIEYGTTWFAGDKVALTVQPEDLT
ncbi:phosphonate metabolism transcriptional regulator PhnF [Pseudotabrizicola sp. L79]|uniref:phosphonate metabolism transcriptional regulator PhnF n=1 Tax=Pseudotabrizicola sp. L79 TaxID=3118402 RepID=UPI002F951A52